MKKVILFLIPAILVPIIVCRLSALWITGGNFFWQPVDNFTLPVDEVLFVKEFGDGFWVRANDGEIYNIRYPCGSEQGCWSKTDDVPEPNPYVESVYSEGSCETGANAFPTFPKKIKSCVTTIIRGGESLWITSVALTEDHRLWFWDQPWASPYTILGFIATWTLYGAIAGVFIGAILAWKVK